MLPTVFATLRTHSALSYAGLLWEKCSAALHWYEIPNNTNFYYYRLHARILRILPITFCVVAPLGAVGVVLGISGRRRCLGLLLLLGMHTVSILLTYVSSRFRTPLTVALLPFAGLTLVRLGQVIGKGDARKASALIFPVLLLFAWTTRPLPSGTTAIRTADFVAPFRFYYLPKVSAAWDDRDLDQVIALLEDFLKTAPPMFKKLNPESVAFTGDLARTAAFFATIRRNYAQALCAAGRKDEAQVSLEHATTLEHLSITR